MAYTRINWENQPSENTPISAENLNIMDLAIDTIDTRVDNVESIIKYITATYVINGDYKINIANDLVTGMVINVIFPTATVSGNARISIDNGVTYKNIGNNIDTTLSSLIIKDNTMELMYNGTYWVIIKRTGQPMVRVRRSSNVTLAQYLNTLTFNTEVYDRANFYDYATNQTTFTIPESGVYKFETFIHFVGQVTGARCFHQIDFTNQGSLTNNVIRGNDTTYTGADVTLAPVSHMVYLPKGCTFVVTCYVEVANIQLMGAASDTSSSSWISCTRVMDI